MAKRLTPRQRHYLAGFRKGMRVAMAEARQLFREEMTATVKELTQLKWDYATLAVKYHQDLRDRAVEAAVQEREREPFKPLH